MDPNVLIELKDLVSSFREDLEEIESDNNALVLKKLRGFLHDLQELEKELQK